MLLILYFTTRLFSHYRVSSETTTSVIVIYREETNGRKTEKESAMCVRVCMCVYVCEYPAEYRGTRVKMYDHSVREVQEKGIEIRILFLYVKKRKNYCIKYCIIYTHAYRLYEARQAMRKRKMPVLALATF